MSEWSEAEKSALLMQVIAQLKPEKGGIDWDRISVEGRTKKACRMTWGRFTAGLQQQQQQQQEAGKDGAAKSPAPKTAAPRKRRGKKEQQQAGSEDDEDVPSPAKKPRGRQRKPKVEDNVDVPSSDFIKDRDDYGAVKAEVRPKIEECI